MVMSFYLSHESVALLFELVLNTISSKTLIDDN